MGRRDEPVNQLLNCINTKQATIEALRIYRDMCFKRDNAPVEVREINDRLTSIGGMSDSTPVQGTPTPTDVKWTEAISKKDALMRGYISAVEFLNQFEPCWMQLSEDDRWMLEVRYIDGYRGDNSIQQIMDRYFVEKTVAYERSNRALNKLARLLYW